MKNSVTYLAILLFTISFIGVMGQNSTGLTNQTETTSPKKLKFLVPSRELVDFVKVGKRYDNGSYDISGFSIDVFRAAADIAIRGRDYELIPFTNDDGVTMNGTFDDMLRKVHDKDFDGAVGETTILSRRMQLVDFTRSYLDTEIGILVRVQATKNGEMVALTPATKVILALVGILGFFILVAVMFWVWKLCQYNLTSSSTQLAVLVIILVLMVLLLTIASYMPRQASLLSLPTLGPVSDVKNLVDLKRKGLKVGYREGAFVKSLLATKGGILESNLVEIESEVEMIDKLQKGGEDGGIDALVAGTHHLKLFQEKHCANFTLVPDFHLKSAGIGFAFKQDHPLSLVELFSEAIVTLIDNGNMTEIQEATIGDLDKVCQDNTENNIGSHPTMQDRISLWLPIASAIFVVALVLVMILSYCAVHCMKK